MGKKSSHQSAPPVDPRVGEAMAKQAALAEKQQDWYETEIYPWMRQQAHKQNEYAEADRRFAKENAYWWRDYAKNQSDRLNERSDVFYNRWKDVYKPVEDTLVADAARYNTSAEAERQAGYGIADTTAAFAKQRQQANMQAQAYGINPTAGAYQAQNRAMDIQQAAAASAAANQARAAAQALGWQKKSQVAALGQQYIGNSLNASGVSNNSAATGGGLANQSVGQASGFGQLGMQNIGQLANVGLQSYQALQNAWGQYGQMGLGVSNHNLQAHQLDQQAAQAAGAQNGQLAGAGAGVAAAAITAF